MSQPRGVYNLIASGGKINAKTLTDPNVDGISIRDSWANVNPGPGMFNWSYLDSVVAIAKQANKKVLIRISDGSINIPYWVMKKVKTTFTFDDPGSGNKVTIPVFWDPFYLQMKGELIAAFGKHYANHPLVTIASVGIANSNSDDWAIPHTPTDLANWAKVGYTSQKLIDACTTIINAMMTAFTTQVMVAATNPNGNLDADPDTVRTAVVAAARSNWGNRLNVSQYNLSAMTFSPPPPPIGNFWRFWSQQSPVAAQMLWFTYGDGSYRNNGGTAGDFSTILTAAVDIGKAYGSQFIEIYQTDCVNLPAVIAHAHSVLTS